MSTLRVDNLQASDGLSPAYATTGIAKAGVTYAQGVPSISDSFNVSSMNDDATGFYDTNITNAFSSADELKCHGHVEYTGTNFLSGNHIYTGGAGGGVTSSFIPHAQYTTSASGNAAEDRVNRLSYVGDLA